METPPPDPIAYFLEVRARAEKTEPWEAAACAMATADARGRPSVRFVLVKEADAQGFWVYTNGESRKGHELAANPWSALAFHWPSEGLQFRIEGPVEKAPAERSDAYFASRPRISQIGAWASDQSQPLASRDALIARVRELEAKWQGEEVPRPPHWCGYRVLPASVEIWKAGEFRLHDRFLYEREGEGWTITRLSP